MKRYKDLFESVAKRVLTNREKQIIDYDGSDNLSYLFDSNGQFIITDDYDITGMRIGSLEGFPVEVHGFLKIGLCELTSLEGCPRFVKNKFDCSDNYLPTLEYGPTDVGSDYNCSVNQLISLKGSPSRLEGYFYCNGNKKLKSLVGGPQWVSGTYDCWDCGLTTLEGCAKYIMGDFDCSHNLELTSYYGLGQVWGDIIANGCMNLDLREYTLYDEHKQVFRAWLKSGLRFNEYIETQEYREALMDSKLNKDIKGLWEN